ncbi:MAG: hypothetical protein L0H53_16500 [Candidatus Nitrosocosmicus sp.]|nr:hypothetical protein [Candidatus Nitrosocosmicus sp.]MDN5869071.1 hypothetical protein [Candidatus Nitrosocosmicus sp.]
MRIKTFCSLTIIPTLILVLLLLSSLDNYSIQTDTYGQPLSDAPVNHSNTDAISSSNSFANPATAQNNTSKY